jgi:hypothetical protein
MAIAVYPPPGPRRERDKYDYMMGAVIVLAVLGLIAYVVWVLVSGNAHFGY